MPDLYEETHEQERGCEHQPSRAGSPEQPGQYQEWNSQERSQIEAPVASGFIDDSVRAAIGSGIPIARHFPAAVKVFEHAVVVDRGWPRRLKDEVGSFGEGAA